MAGIFCGVTALAIPLLRCCLKREGNYLINQLNTLYWLFCMSLGVSAFFYLNNTSGFSLTLAITTALLFVLLSLLLAYQIIKNTFNCSFEEKCFFWALTKQKTVNQISHLHLLFLLIRRMILVMIIGISPKKPLTCLFLSTLATIFIVSNMIINKPFKLHQTSLLAVEILFVLVLILLQMYIVNAPKMGTQSWNVFGFILLVLMLLLTVLVLAIALFECYQLLLKRYAKLYEQQKVKELDSPKEGIQS